MIYVVVEDNQQRGGRETDTTYYHMIKLLNILYERTGPETQGLGSFDTRFFIPTALDRAKFDLRDDYDWDEENEHYESDDTSERVADKTIP